MKYLFFDIECANCFEHTGKIYSFGYVLTDETFEVLESEDMLMNPKVDKWDFYVIKHILAYPRAEILRQPDFAQRYDRIRSLLTDKDTLVFGFSLQNDVKFLFDETTRYGLPPLVFNYYDVQTMLCMLDNSKMPVSLEKAYSARCGATAEDLHRSDRDAFATMMILRSICLERGATPPVVAQGIGYNVPNTADENARRERKKKKKDTK